MRYAGELFRAFGENLRESKLSNNRSWPIGEGAYGVVYQSDVPGNVIKQSTDFNQNLTREADLQAIAAEMGIAPKVAGLETFYGGVGDRIEMEDVRDNFEERRGGKIPGASGSWPVGMDAVRVNQQLGQLALKGVDLDDRHSGNVRYNKMTGRPMQLDFGIATKVEGEMQVHALARATEDGFQAAGLGDVAEIYRDTVYDLLAGGQVAEAMDVAKQGFSRLQKIRSPLEGLAG